MLVIPGIFRYNIIFCLAVAFSTFFPLAFWGEGYLPLWSVLIVPAVILLDMLNPTLVWVDDAAIHVFRVLLPLPAVRHKRVLRAKVDSIEVSYSIVKKASASTSSSIPIKFKHIRIFVLSGRPVFIIKYAWCAPVLRRVARKLAEQIDKPCRIDI